MARDDAGGAAGRLPTRLLGPARLTLAPTRPNWGPARSGCPTSLDVCPRLSVPSALARKGHAEREGYMRMKSLLAAAVCAVAIAGASASAAWAGEVKGPPGIPN